MKGMRKEWNREKEMKWDEKERIRNGESRHYRKHDLHELIGTRETTFLSYISTKRRGEEHVRTVTRRSETKTRTASEYRVVNVEILIP